MPRVFISYTANDDERSPVVLQHLLDHLADEDVVLDWDKDLLKVGDDWEANLLSAIDACDGAILLLSKRALKRPYVVKECTLLAQRKRRSELWGGNTFELLAVFVGGAVAADLSDSNKSHMQELGLDRYQAGNDNDLDTLVTALCTPLKRLKLASASRHSEELLRDIATQIQAAKGRADMKLASNLQIELPGWIERDCSPAVRAFAVAAEMPSRTLRSVGRALAESKDEVAEDAALAIVERLAPFTVPSDAAARIPELAEDSKTKTSLAINAHELDTGRWYVRLAYGRMYRDRTTEATNADAGLRPDLLFQEIVESVMDKVIADTLEEAKAQLREMGPPFFVFVVGHKPVAAVIDKVHDDLPTITLVFLTGEKVPPDRFVTAGTATLLEPLLKHEQEENAQRHYVKTKKEVKRAHADG